MPGITYIVAANYAQALVYARDRELHNGSWRHVNIPEQLLGIENPLVVFLPGWAALPQAESIAEVVQIMTRRQQ